MNKPKILIFSLAWKPFLGGAEIAVQEIARRLQNDFDFELITYKFDSSWPSQEGLDGIKVHRVRGKGFGGKYFYYRRAVQKAEELHRQHNYNYVWGLLGSHGGLAAWKFKRLHPEIKYLLTEQTGDSQWFWWLRTWWWRPIFKKIYQQADGVQVISRYLEAMVRNYGYQGKIWIVPNGVAVKNDEMIEPDPKLRKELGLNEADKVILTVSRLVKKNAVQDLIKSLKFLPANYKLVIIGTGKQAGRLKKLTLKNNLSQQVKFLGNIPYEQVLDYYRVADVFCRPSLSEGFGNVFIEAMSQKVPVVATPVGGIVDFLKDKETGLFCQVRNPQSIAGCLRELSENDELREHIIAKAFLMVKDKYSWDEITQQMRKVFRSL